MSGQHQDAATDEHRVRSADGTMIALQRGGAGPPVVMVDPAGGYRDFDNIRGLGALLAEHFTVHTYDRRGRGNSTDTQPYAIQREVDDLEAVIDAAGGAAMVYGLSSGALLAVHAAASGLPIRKLALFEPPIDPDGQPGDDLSSRVAERVDAGERGEAVDLFLGSIGVPDEVIAGMGPVKPALERVAHTLVYDCTIAESTPLELLGEVTVPALVMDSEASSDDLTGGAAAVAEALPLGAHRRLPGEWHGVADEELAPVLMEFFRA
ncbi:alpha/beta hydrolase [Egibacter rhizosphaerae]|uniref:Alpha/beta hydrolase n=1 Tax=Egibacter rhizosphaerae TaxID=1670831 RepID=A0A411YFB1_9ACTN|nr:alpha/beta hydrolase [Egibacter rhizosphaerae]QBI19869.1 alpha/beta hydrolase [Egibacter rhizosphaerae]